MENITRCKMIQTENSF